MKPSEIIGDKGFNAMLEYLDKEKERVNEILHEIARTMYDGTMGDTDQINYLHQMIDEKLAEHSTPN